MKIFSFRLKVTRTPIGVVITFIFTALFLAKASAVPSITQFKTLAIIGQTSQILVDVTSLAPGSIFLSIKTPPQKGTAVITYKAEYVYNSTKNIYEILKTPNIHYTPTSTGYDQMIVEVSDSTGVGLPAKVEILNRPSVASNNGVSLLILAKADIAPYLGSELAILKQDLAREGFFVRMVSIPAVDSKEVWATIKAQSELPNQILAGAILVGRIPYIRNGIKMLTACANCISDYPYMNTQKYLSTKARNLWVSRISTHINTDFAGDELTLMRRALSANHLYRNGLSRLPNRGFYYDDVGYRNYTTSISDVWGQAEYLEPSAAFRKGAEIIQETSHGGPTIYNGGKVSSNGIHNLLAQANFVSAASCVSGRPGGVVNNQLFTRGGSNVLSYGSSATTYVGYNDIMSPKSSWSYINGDYLFRMQIKSGDTWGGAFHQNDPFGDIERGIIYGDLSVRSRVAPHNEMPIISSLTSSSLTGFAPLSVSFSATATDPDGSIQKIEWFTLGHGYGKIAPTAVGVLSAYQTYQLAHNYPARIQAIDQFKAIAYKELLVSVKPKPRAAFRIDIGSGATEAGMSTINYYPGLDMIDQQNNLWLHDQRAINGNWGWVDSGNNTQSTLRTIASSTDEKLFQTYRTDYHRKGFTYQLPVGQGKFKLNLGFAEPINKTPGARLIDIYVNGVLILGAFDIFAQVGRDHAVVKSFDVSSTSGILQVMIKTAANSPAGENGKAILNTLELLPVN